MNWDGLGMLIGSLPGAGIGGLVGALLAAFTFESFASACPMGGPFVGICASRRLNL